MIKEGDKKNDLFIYHTIPYENSKYINQLINFHSINE